MDTYGRMKDAKPSSGYKTGKETGFFLNWKDGDNLVRLAGGYVEMRTHFVAPNVRQKLRGICKMEAFEKGDGSISQVINCLDWDIKTESATKVQTCPICKLYHLASKLLSENPSEAEKKFYTELKTATQYKTGYRWNVLDRDNPFVSVTDGGTTSQVLGFKIATLGKEAFGDVRGIFMQCGFDISAPDTGVDIKITKGNSNGRVAYQAQVILQGTAVKQTPFTAEEKALQLRDIKQICGKQYAVAAIIAAMHDDLREMLTVYEEDSATAVGKVASADAAVDAALKEAENTPVKVPAPVRAAAGSKEDDMPF